LAAPRQLEIVNPFATHQRFGAALWQLEKGQLIGFAAVVPASRALFITPTTGAPPASLLLADRSRFADLACH
jgi:hypothetical protein